MALAFSMVAVGCGGATPEPAAPTTASNNSGASSTADASGDQVALGAKLYTEKCAGCHGAGGEGNAKVPAVVGKNALPLGPAPPTQLRKSKFHTAADVFQFVKTSM